MQPMEDIRFSEGEDSLWELVAQLTPEGVSSERKKLKQDELKKEEKASTHKLEKTLSLLEECAPLSLERAYELLVQIRQGDSLGISIKSTASPLLMPATGHAIYIVRKGTQQTAPAEAGTEKISVSFQSVKNCELAWFTETEGVASRPMSRTTQGKYKNEHGCRGRFYSLIKRAPGDQNQLPAKRRRGPKNSEHFAEVIAFGDGLVQAWRLANCPRAITQIASQEETTSIGTTEPASLQATSTIDRMENSSLEDTEEDPLLHEATTTFQGTVRICGDLRVDGTVFGVLSSKPRCADYAEYFEWDSSEANNPPPPGSVVRLKSPEQKLTLDTSGDGPCLIVSTSPSVAAGVPNEDTSRGALVAFLGQVPVRVFGQVKVGDQLVPSGRNDGTAMALRTLLNEQHMMKRHKSNRNLLERWLRSRNGASASIPTDQVQPDSLGIAMEATKSISPEKQSENSPQVVLSFVRWNHAIRRELHEHLDKVAHSYQQRWMSAFVDVITSLAMVAAVFEATHTIARIIKAIDSNAYGPVGILVFRAVAIVAFAASVLNFILIIAFFVLFSVNRVQGGKSILFFWCLFVGIFIGITQAYLAFRYIFNFTNILYCLLLIHLMGKIRGSYLPAPCGGSWTEDCNDSCSDSSQDNDDNDDANDEENPQGVPCRQR